MQTHGPHAAWLGGSLGKRRERIRPGEAPLQELEACRHDGGGWLREAVAAAAVVTTAEAAVLQSHLGKQKPGVNSSRMGGAPHRSTPCRAALPLPVPKGPRSPAGRASRAGGL